ncbi:MAG: AmmeMemoRadiSam system protein A [Treponema sp.]|jgi:AmmeMemoRadiSam system protein A|nr:AmmeMemoRadiSam system protein A [Treponema sp.]
MNFTINTEERNALLQDARETIAAVLEKRSPRYRRSPEMKEAARTGVSALTWPCGAFVTLHAGGKLRGCIGRMAPPGPLEKTVRSLAAESAFRDPRFPPLSRNELDGCRIEISVLSPLEPCDDPRQVAVGVHGLLLEYRGRSGVLLPQVPVEQGWNREEYLDGLCAKAGLPAHSYDRAGARLSTFTATVFGE